MTRKQALDKAAAMLIKAETNTLSNESVGKYLNLAQMYMTLAHELGVGRGTVRENTYVE